MQKVTQFSLRCQAAAYALLATSGIHPVYGLAFPPLNFSQSHKDKKKKKCLLGQMILVFLLFYNNKISFTEITFG